MIEYQTRDLRPRGKNNVRIRILRQGVEIVVDGVYCKCGAGATLDLPRSAAQPLLDAGAADLITEAMQ